MLGDMYFTCKTFASYITYNGSQEFRTIPNSMIRSMWQPYLSLLLSLPTSMGGGKKKRKRRRKKEENFYGLCKSNHCLSKVTLDGFEYPSCIRTRNQLPQFTRVVETCTICPSFCFSFLIQHLDRYCYHMRIPVLTLKSTLLCRQRSNYEEPGTATCKRLMTKSCEIQSFQII